MENPSLFIVTVLTILGMPAPTNTLLATCAGRIARAGGKAQWVPRIGAAVVSIFALSIVASPFFK